MTDRRAVPRYALSMPIRVRVPELDPGSTHVGKTLEVSTRGVQFTLDRAIDPGTVLDFTISLQPEFGQQVDSFIHGTGSVSRIVEQGDTGYRVSIAVSRFQISRNDSSEGRQKSPTAAKMDAEWTLTGTYFETCNCDVGCPCVFLSPPTNDECTSLIGWHVEKGVFAGTVLDDLNVAIAVHAPGDMMKSKWKAAVYIDDRATPEQKDALEKIFSGLAGGHLTKLVAQIGELLGVKSVPIEYSADGRKRRLRIPHVAEMEIEGISGQDGNSVKITNHPFCVAIGHPAEVAKSKRLSFTDHGYKWDITDKNGFFSRFHYTN